MTYRLSYHCADSFGEWDSDGWCNFFDSDSDAKIWAEEELKRIRENNSDILFTEPKLTEVSLTEVQDRFICNFV